MLVLWKRNMTTKMKIQQSHHQLQDALDIGLPTQVLVHIMRFDI